MAATIAVVTSYALLVIPMSSLQLLQLGTVPISLFSKIPQISENYRNKSTGQLSVFAVASQVFGCAARLFTTATEMGDSLVFAGFALAFVLNVILGLQIWLYWGQTVPVSTTTKEQWPKEKIGLTTTHSPDAFAPTDRRAEMGKEGRLDEIMQGSRAGVPHWLAEVSDTKGTTGKETTHGYSPGLTTITTPRGILLAPSAVTATAVPPRKRVSTAPLSPQARPAALGQSSTSRTNIQRRLATYGEQGVAAASLATLEVACTAESGIPNV
ncbi:4978_t:CDS:2, partial [Acaulospora colombiana]